MFSKIAWRQVDRWATQVHNHTHANTDTKYKDVKLFLCMDTSDTVCQHQRALLWQNMVHKSTQDQLYMSSLSGVCLLKIITWLELAAVWVLQLADTKAWDDKGKLCLTANQLIKATADHGRLHNVPFTTLMKLYTLWNYFNSNHFPLCLIIHALFKHLVECCFVHNNIRSLHKLVFLLIIDFEDKSAFQFYFLAATSFLSCCGSPPKPLVFC